MIRRFLTVVVAVATIITPLATQAAPRAGWRWEQCKFRHLEGGTAWSRHEVQLTIDCAVDRWAVPGGRPAAVCIASHESGLNERNRNPYSGAAGVYQFIPSRWPPNQPAIFARWHLRPSIYNARTNVVAAVRIAHMGDWSPWTTHGLCGV